MNIIPVITLKQPWATWVMLGMKKIETRTHTKFKELEGKEFGIHAGKAIDTSDDIVNNPYVKKDVVIKSIAHCQRGKLLGFVSCYKWRELNETHSKDALIDCKTKKRYGSFLHNIKPYMTPIPFVGELGIWYIDLNTMEKSTREKYLAQFK